MKRNIWHLAMGLFKSRIGKTFGKSLRHIVGESVRTSTQCCDKWDKMKKKYFQEKIGEGVTSLQLLHGFGSIG